MKKRPRQRLSFIIVGHLAGSSKKWVTLAGHWMGEAFRLDAPVALTPRELVRQRVETLLASERPGLAYEDVLVSRGVRAQNLGLLPSTLPYAIEAIRGEGAYLVDRTGYRFMHDYDERGELAPRDVVSQAIVSQMKAHL